jgi:flagellar basal body-associated protein FliL
MSNLIESQVIEETLKGESGESLIYIINQCNQNIYTQIEQDKKPTSVIKELLSKKLQFTSWMWYGDHSSSISLTIRSCQSIKIHFQLTIEYKLKSASTKETIYIFKLYTGHGSESIDFNTFDELFVDVEKRLNYFYESNKNVDENENPPEVTSLIRSVNNILYQNKLQIHPDLTVAIAKLQTTLKNKDDSNEVSMWTPELKDQIRKCIVDLNLGEILPRYTKNNLYMNHLRKLKQLKTSIK